MTRRQRTARLTRFRTGLAIRTVKAIVWKVLRQVVGDEVLRLAVEKMRRDGYSEAHINAVVNRFQEQRNHNANPQS